LFSEDVLDIQQFAKGFCLILKKRERESGHHVSDMAFLERRGSRGHRAFCISLSVDFEKKRERTDMTGNASDLFLEDVLDINTFHEGFVDFEGKRERGRTCVSSYPGFFGRTGRPGHS
jgi:hypothetical protein